jgi:serine/threonine-protein kinase
MDAFFCPEDGARLSGADPAIGAVVGGDVVLTAQIGRGASGRVYRGHQRSVGRDVAVKILHPELCARTDHVRRFEREARVASSLQHPNVVGVYTAGRLESGMSYIVMEYLDGPSLREALDAAGGVFDLDRALGIALQICEGCIEAHARGIVHRDLKPENVTLVTRDGCEHVKIVDFGIAKTGDGGSSAGLVFGTARYISPEAAAGARTSPASDVYAIATILYEMLAGRAPFDAADGLALLVKQIHDPAPDIRTFGGVPEPLARVVMENLAKDPARRACDARALRDALLEARAAIAPANRGVRRPALARIAAMLVVFLLGFAVAAGARAALHRSRTHAVDPPRTSSLVACPPTCLASVLRHGGHARFSPSEHAFARSSLSRLGSFGIAVPLSAKSARYMQAVPMPALQALS